MRKGQGMHVLDMDRDLCESFLIDRYHATTEPLTDGCGFKASFPCGNGSDNALGRPMTIDGALETTISFLPYDMADRNVISIWTSSLSNIDEASKLEAMNICNNAVLVHRPRFLKPFIDDDGSFYCGAQGFVDEEASPLRLIRAFLEEIDEFWPTVQMMRML